MATGKKNNEAHEVPKIPTSSELLKMAETAAAAADKTLKPSEKKEGEGKKWTGAR